MKVIFKTLTGSRAYGTNIESSDWDYKGVYIQPVEDLVGFKYREQVESKETKTVPISETVMYEVRRFLELLSSANPTMLEMLFVGEGAVVQSDPKFKLITAVKKEFLTKRCSDSFGGYAVSQIKKSKGLDKKQNWEEHRTVRKTPMDFMYVLEQGKTIGLGTCLRERNMPEGRCGLVALDHAPGVFALYFDWEFNANTTLGYRGIQLEDSNAPRLSSVPKGESPEYHVYFNQDAYVLHCKEFNEYQTWLTNRNVARYVDKSKHGQSYDGKNLLHLRRLLDCAFEIATTGTFSVWRPNAEYLLSIRRGEVPLDEIIEQAEKDLILVREAFADSNLPNNVDKEFLHTLLLKVRGL